MMAAHQIPATLPYAAATPTSSRPAATAGSPLTRAMLPPSPAHPGNHSNIAVMPLSCSPLVPMMRTRSRSDKEKHQTAAVMAMASGQPGHSSWLGSSGVYGDSDYHHHHSSHPHPPPPPPPDYPTTGTYLSL